MNSYFFRESCVSLLVLDGNLFDMKKVFISHIAWRFYFIELLYILFKITNLRLMSLKGGIVTWSGTLP